MKKGVQSPGSDAIAVAAQLLHHGQAKDSLLPRMQQHVHADESVIQLPPVALHSTLMILHFRWFVLNSIEVRYIVRAEVFGEG